MSSQAEQLQNDIRLIQEVERHTNLYDPRCKDKDSKSKENTWTIIGINLNVPAHVCKNRWKNLRDKYTREKKLMMIEGEESYRNHPWPLLDEMSFLWNFVSHRNRPQEMQTKKLENEIAYKCVVQPEWDSITVKSNIREESNSVESNFPDPTCVLVEEEENLETNDDEYGPPRSKLRKLLENRDGYNSDSQIENPDDCNHNSERLESVKESYPFRFTDEEFFCLSLAATLRRLSRKKCSLLKIKILQILHEAQFGDS